MFGRVGIHCARYHGRNSDDLTAGRNYPEQLEDVLGLVVYDAALKGDPQAVPKSPGMKYTHYSPRGEVQIVSGELEDMVETIRIFGKKKRLWGWSRDSCNR